MAAAKQVQSGDVFDRLTVICPDPERGKKYHLCRCDCGTEKSIRYDHLQTGKTRSCGCLHKELSSARAWVLQEANTVHGMCGTRVHTVWMGMLDRCRNPNNAAFHHYGGRGITVCRRWQDFSAFYADMGDPPEGFTLEGFTLERRHNGRGYSPANCYWATRKEQQNNRRANHRLTFNGETKTVTQWAETLGLPRNTLDERLRRGWSVAKAIDPQRYRPNGLALGQADTRTHCKRGHELTDDNVYQYKTKRLCKACIKIRQSTSRPVQDRTGLVHHRAKLSDDDVRAILASSERVGELARIYGVHQSTVSKLRSGARRRATLPSAGRG